MISGKVLEGTKKDLRRWQKSVEYLFSGRDEVAYLKSADKGRDLGKSAGDKHRQFHDDGPKGADVEGGVEVLLRASKNLEDDPEIEDDRSQDEPGTGGVHRGEDIGLRQDGVEEEGEVESKGQEDVLDDFLDVLVLEEVLKEDAADSKDPADSDQDIGRIGREGEEGRGEKILLHDRGTEGKKGSNHQERVEMPSFSCRW